MEKLNLYFHSILTCLGLPGGDGDDTLEGNSYSTGILYGGDGDDILEGDSYSDNTLYGGDGDDVLTSDSGDDNTSILHGNAGNDVLIGSAANDTLTGGLGRDQFVYNTNAPFDANVIGVDTITDFRPNSDKIVLDKTTFTALTSVPGVGFSQVEEFVTVRNDVAAATSDAFVTYSRATGNLFYNPNGDAAGFGMGDQFAALTGIPTLAATDFIIQA